MKKYLITGCAGFIGSNFVHYMLKKYPEILLVNLDKLTYAGNLENLKDVEGDPRHVFVQGDICDKELVESLFAKYDFDYVINFAAESHVDRSIKNPEIFVQSNVMGTVNLLQATTNSINTAYVDLEGQMDDGPENTLAFAQAAGLPKAAGWEPISRVPLGIPEVSPLSQATGYATFARDGKHIDTHVVAQVKDASGAVVYAADTPAEQTVDADALAQTLAEDLFALHIDQLVLQAGRTAVDNQNFHGISSLKLGRADLPFPYP